MYKSALFLVVLILTAGFVSAGLSDILDSIRESSITGRATSDTTSINISVGNSVPVINFVKPIGSQSVTENGKTTVSFTFTATDADGVSNLNDATAQTRFQKTGETTRSNTSCGLIGDLDSTTANYSCSIDFWYFDGSGPWIINVTIEDINSAKVENSSSNVTLSETTCMVMSPTSLSWPSIGITDTNILSNTDPILLNNTCNDPIAAGSIQVTAINLIGEETPSQIIYAGNFTADETDACDAGPTLVNGTAVGITGAVLPKGNHSVNNGATGQEQLYLCVEAINPDLSSQAYSTAAGGAWTIGVV